MATATKIQKFNPHRGSNVFGNQYAPQQLTYDILDGLYQNTILKKIITKYVANIVPNYFTLTIEDEHEKRLYELELECKELSSVLNKKLFRQMWKSYLLYGTAILYDGNRNENDIPEEIFVIHPRDIDVEIYEPGPHYGEIKYWSYNYGGKTFKIPPEYIKVFANDPDIGSIFGNSIVNHLQDTLHQFLNNRLDLAEILNRYAIPIVQWAVDVAETPDEKSQDNLITKARMMLEEQLDAGDDIVMDARIEARTLSFGNDVGHLISILQESRRDLGMLSIPESLMGGEISNLSGGKTQAAVFMQEIANYRGEQNDFLAEEYYVPHLDKKGHVRGKDFHNIYLAIPPATTELPSESIIWVNNSLQKGLITPNEGRAMLGFRGAAPGIAKVPQDNIGWIEKALQLGLITLDEGREYLGFEGPAPGVTPEMQKVVGMNNPVIYNNEDDKEKDDPKQDEGAKNNKKVQEPKNRDGREPTKYAEDGKK